MTEEGLSGPADSALVERAQAGDRVAFEALYRRHVGRLHGLCLRLTQKTTEAEEMTQEVFVRAWRNLATFRSGTHFLAWLHRVAVNLARNEWRARGRRGQPLELKEERAEGPSPTPVAGLGMDLERAIGELPPGARAVFLLHDVHGYRHQEIAEMHGVAVGTTKAQLHRARRILRKVLS